jgi:hypothetical protein
VGRETIASLAAACVLGVWSAAALDAIVRDRYGPLQLVTPVMLLLAGALWGVRLIRNGNGNGKGR